MVDPLFRYPSAYVVTSGPRRLAALRSRPTARGLGPVVARLAPSDGEVRRSRLTGCLPTGHDRSMNGTSDQKQLVRPREGRMVAGVCAGIGQFFGIDANIVRIIFAILTVFSAGAAALVYVVAWVVVPEEGEKGSIAENYLNKNKT